MKKILLLIFIGFAFAMEDKKDEALSSAEVCPICCEEIGESEAVLTCADLCDGGVKSHIFHYQCLKFFLMYGTGVYACPQCNRPLKTEAQVQFPRTSERIRALMRGMAQVNVDLEELLVRVRILAEHEEESDSDDLSDAGVACPSCSIM
jgi:hypothetical protein